MVLNAVLAFGLSPVIGFTAAAIGTSLTGWAMVALLLNGTRTMADAATFDDRFKARIVRIVLASIAMGVVLYVAATLMSAMRQWSV